VVLPCVDDTVFARVVLADVDHCAVHMTAGLNVDRVQSPNQPVVRALVAHRDILEPVFFDRAHFDI
jgi:hypothetical protein